VTAVVVVVEGEVVVVVVVVVAVDHSVPAARTRDGHRRSVVAALGRFARAHFPGLAVATPYPAT
jgi:hypothetical protein